MCKFFLTRLQLAAAAVVGFSQNVKNTDHQNILSERIPNGPFRILLYSPRAKIEIIRENSTRRSGAIKRTEQYTKLTYSLSYGGSGRSDYTATVCARYIAVALQFIVYKTLIHSGLKSKKVEFLEAAIQQSESCLRCLFRQISQIPSDITRRSDFSDRQILGIYYMNGGMTIIE